MNTQFFNGILVCCVAELLHFHATYGNEYKDNSGLTAVPSNIPPNTVIVKLSSNQITTIDDNDFVGLNMLEELDLGGNQLSTFPHLKHIKGTLRKLTLSFNNINYISPDFLDILTKLEVLELIRNKITSFPDVAGPQNTLHEIWLDENQLTTFPSFRNIGASLQNLYIKSNNMNNFPRENALFENRSPSIPLNIYLQDNNLQSIPPVIGIGTSLLVIYATMNPLVCDDAMVWLVYLKDTNKDGKCKQPPWLKRTSLSKLSVDKMVPVAMTNPNPTYMSKRLLKDTYNLATPLITWNTKSLVECLLFCAGEPGCRFMNYFTGEDYVTNCHYSSPLSGVMYTDIPSTGRFGWMYYVVDEVA